MSTEKFKRYANRYQGRPLVVKVGDVSVTCRNVKQCMELTECAKRLGESTPNRIRIDGVSVYTGAANTTGAVESAKELAKATPPSVKFMGLSGKAGTTKGLFVVLATVAGLGLAYKYGSKGWKWLKNKCAKPSDQKNGNNPVGGGEMQPKDQSVNEIRNERTITNYDDGQLVGKLIYMGDKAVIFSEYGTGKTVLTMGIALDIAHGRVSKIVPCDNGIHKPQTVFYYDGESDPEDYVNIFGDHEIDTENLHVIRKFYFKDPNAWLNDVRKNLKDVPGDATVILDNISCIVSTFNPNTIRELFLRDFTMIQNDFAPRKVTFIVVAHTNKQKELMGSNNQNNFATSVLKLVKQGDDYLRLEVIKNRKYGDMKGNSYLLAKRVVTDTGFKYDEYVDESVLTNDGKKNSKADKIPPEIVQKMKEFYQKGVPGHGYQSVIKEFHLDTEYGIKDSTEVCRILESLEK